MSDVNVIPREDAFIGETTGDDGLGVLTFPHDGAMAPCLHGSRFQMLTHEPTAQAVILISPPPGLPHVIFRWSLSPDRLRSVAAQMLQMANHLDGGKGKQ